MVYARGAGLTHTFTQTKLRLEEELRFERISILPFDPQNHNKRLMWLTQESGTVLTDSEVK